MQEQGFDVEVYGINDIFEDAAKEITMQENREAGKAQK